MKRHSLSPPMQRDGCAALAALCLGSAAGLAAMAKEKEGVEVLVAAMLLCAREKVQLMVATYIRTYIHTYVRTYIHTYDEGAAHGRHVLHPGPRNLNAAPSLGPDP